MESTGCIDLLLLSSRSSPATVWRGTLLSLVGWQNQFAHISEDASPLLSIFLYYFLPLFLSLLPKYFLARSGIAFGFIRFSCVDATPSRIAPRHK